MKSGDKAYTHFTISKRQIQLSITYFKDVKEEKNEKCFTFIAGISIE